MMDTDDGLRNETPLSVPQQRLATLYSERYGISIYNCFSSGYKFRVANLDKINSYYSKKSKRKIGKISLPADSCYPTPQDAVIDLKFIVAALLEGYDLNKITKDKFEGLNEKALSIESSLLAAATTTTTAATTAAASAANTDIANEFETTGVTI